MEIKKKNDRKNITTTIFFVSGNCASSSPTSPFFDNSKLTSPERYSPSRAHLPSFLGGFFNANSRPISSSSTSSVFDRFPQGQEKSERNDRHDDAVKPSPDGIDEIPSKRFKESSSNLLQKKPLNIYNSSEKLNATSMFADSDVDKKQKKSSHTSDDCGNDVNASIASSDTFRPHQHDESDVACFSESSVPSPCMATVHPSLSTREEGAHGMTLKGSASFLHIPVATAEL